MTLKNYLTFMILFTLLTTVVSGIEYEYDGLDRVAKSVGDSGKITIYSYYEGLYRDSVPVLYEQNIDGGKEIYTYSEYGDLTKETYSNMPWKDIEYIYDKYQNLISTNSSEGYFRYVYDLKGNLANVSRTLNEQTTVVEYRYDLNNNLIWQKDDRGEIFKEYDMDNKVSSYLERNPSGILIKEISYIYDSKGRMIETLNSFSGKESVSYGEISYNCSAEICAEEVIVEYVQEYLNGRTNTYQFTYDEYGDVSQVTLNDKVIESYECNDQFCKYFDGVTSWYESNTQYEITPQVEICDGLDNNNNSIVDENCDQDNDFFVNPNMTCNGSFYSESNTVRIKANESDLNITLEEGWNVVYAPINGTINATYFRDRFTDPSQRCIVTENFWSRNEERNQYSLETEITAGETYWVYSLNNCTIPLGVDFDLVDSQFELTSNWNFMPYVDNFKEVYAKSNNPSDDFQHWTDSGYVTTYGNESYSINGFWVYWRPDQLLSCSRVDLDDLNSEVNQ
ncbi:hypothetical protein HOA56_00625 [archaeon]|jgi:YD repeat-containing protein|nr:hypothetical protein [Candidatus Woesearchaeota archaeon]MBT6820906.1 hypothetical protein [archaeon]